jgi:BCD family chlorophyll transporter-like MFS transporter
VGLALATDLSPPEARPKVVGLMYFMLFVGMILSSLVFGFLLKDFSPGSLIRSIQGAAVLTLVLNITALWKQEARTKRLGDPHEEDVDFVSALKLFTQGDQALRRLLAVGLGTMAFSMGDVLLEPFGGEILHLAVSDTTLLTALLAFGGLTGFALASNVLSRGADPFRMACGGVLVGVPAFTAVLMSAPQASLLLFSLGTLFIGFGAGLFGHGTLTATMNHAPPGQAGLALGAWGAVQATAAGLAMGLGGIIRDLMALVVDSGSAYACVYSLEVVLLLITLYAMYPLIAKKVP